MCKKKHNTTEALLCIINSTLYSMPVIKYTLAKRHQPFTICALLYMALGLHNIILEQLLLAVSVRTTKKNCVCVCVKLSGCFVNIMCMHYYTDATCNVGKIIRFTAVDFVCVFHCWVCLYNLVMAYNPVYEFYIIANTRRVWSAEIIIARYLKLARRAYMYIVFIDLIALMPHALCTQSIITLRRVCVPHITVPHPSFLSVVA